MDRGLKNYDIPEMVINGHTYHTKGILRGLYDNVEDLLAKEIFDFFKTWYSPEENFSIYTSGSTGDPKLIYISRNQMVASARQTIDYFGLMEKDKLLLCLNPKVIGGKMMLVRAFIHNMKIIAMTPSVNPFEKLELSERLDFTALSPHQLFHVVKAGTKERSMIEKMKAVIVGGAPVLSALRELVQELEVPVYSTYGMTETVSHVALQRLNGPGQVDFFFGLGDVEFGTNENSCLTIKGSVTNHKLLTTQDHVKLLSTRHFRWLGRADNMINSGGIKIGIDLLERKIGESLAQDSNSCRFFIFPLSDRALGQKVCLAIESLEPVEDRLIEKFDKVLHKYEKPKEVFMVEKFVETSSGKIDRRKTIELIRQKSGK